MGVWHKKLLKSEEIDISWVKCFYKWNNFLENLLIVTYPKQFQIVKKI